MQQFLTFAPSAPNMPDVFGLEADEPDSKLVREQTLTFLQQFR